jgi:hypothetical protein
MNTLTKSAVRIILSIMVFFIASCSEVEKQPDLSQPSQKEGKEKSQFRVLESSESQITFKNEIIKESEAMNCFSFFNIYNGGGVAIGDLNNDALPDIYFTGNQVENKLYLNAGNLKFEDITAASNTKGSSIWTTGVTMADVNADGWLDIYVCQSGSTDNTEEAMKNLLYINNHDLTFTESAEAFGIADMARSNHAAFFDYDNDGDLDVYILNHPLGFGDYITTRLEKAKNPKDSDTDKLFENNGNNTFTEVTNAAGLRNYGFGLSVSISDYNNDGWSDIFVANDYSEPDHLYMNNGNGTFTDKIHESMNHISQFSMGSDAGDINNDGLADVFVLDMMAEDNKRKKTNMQGMDIQAFYTNFGLGRHLQYMQNMLHLNRGNEQFSDIAEMAGVANTDWSWSPLLLDLDNDGWKDIYITNGIKKDLRNNDFQKTIKGLSYSEITKNHAKISANIPTKPINNYAYQNQKDLTFKKANTDWGLNYIGFSNGAAYGDLDNDGDLDMVVNNMDSESMIIENKTEASNYFRVKLSGDDNNPFGIGTKVEIKADGNHQFQQLYLGHGFLSSSEPIVHFGIGSASKIQEMIITWPNGTSKLYSGLDGNQTFTANQKDAAQVPFTSKKKTIAPYFKSIYAQSGISFSHEETFYEDYDKEILIPHRYSQNGPFLAVGDVNNDKLDDFYIGGAAGFSGKLFLQNSNGKFHKSNSQPWAKHSAREDLGSLLFDADGDGDLDLYITSGSNEFPKNTSNYQDRLYINDGEGSFVYEENRIPKNTSSTSKVTAGDFDNDGDLDLFVGGRIVPGEYPTTPKSSLLINTNGVFTDQTKELAPELEDIGMVTDAIWVDYDNDNDLDLVITGEWMPITIMNNDNNKLKNSTVGSGLGEKTGWWYGITSGDFDNDGDIDFMAGNLGLNSKYQTTNGPLEVYAGDLDNNGNHDIILGYYSEGECFPLRGKTCSSQQMPGLNQKIPTYDIFGSSNILDVYGESLKTAFNRKANWFTSSYIENLGNGKFKITALPNLAQLSATNSLITMDVDKDGNLDVILGGNMHSAEIETARHDASYGLVLLGDGKGNFNPLENRFTNLDLKGDVKNIQLLHGSKNNPLILVGTNWADVNLLEISLP